jgi:hypothetical protein
MASTLHTRFESSGFLPLGTPKILVYAAPVDNEKEHRTADACQTILNWPGIFERTRRSRMRCVDACTESRGALTINVLFQL